MRIIGPEHNRAAMIAAAQPVSIEKDPPGPPSATGFTDAQQAALYYARKRRRQRLGVTPGPPASPSALYLQGLNPVLETSPAGTNVGTLYVLNGTGTYTFTKTADPDAAFTLTGAVLTTAGVWDYETKTFHPVTISATNGTETLVRTINVPVINVVAANLSAPNAVPASPTTANLYVTTDQDNGTLYAVVTTSATPPTPAQVKAGQDNLGAAAKFAGNQALSTAGFKTFLATGLVTATAYSAFFMHERLPAEDSTVAASPRFTQP